ncbi:MAG TPA: nitrate reductase molybdenum cofactor assembly chaperone [Thermodesulfobacteriota bacterium]
MVRRRLLALFADILDYPGPGLARAVGACEALAASASAEAASLLGAFRTFVEQTPLARLEEVYTATFDLDAACHPYVGYHLFGETYKRSVFLVGLRERYRAIGYLDGAELPDHVAVLLRFLALTEDAAQAEEVVQEALLPALERMTAGADAGPEEAGHEPKPAHYRPVLRALYLVLGGEAARAAAV